MQDEEPIDRMSRRDLLLGMNAALLAFGAGSAMTALARNHERRRAGPSAANGPHAVREIENTWIVMPDGVKLAARIWVPVGAERHPVPAIFNYCPYFARLFTRPDDDARFPYYASHGYACVRVDIRGSGDSEGLPMDEYVQQEQDDGVEIIRWIASQPWCSGSVGMEGISWSGFNSLQVAARRPPALKAIITHCSTDDRYADDAHYKGGCILEDMFDWGTAFLALQGQPSDPDITGHDGWRESWLEAIERGGVQHRSLVRSSVSGRFLEARFGDRGLRAHPVPGLRRRRMGGCVQELDFSPAQGSEGSPQRARGALDPYLSSPGRARAGHRLLERGAALVGSLAEGRRHRHHEGADAARLDAVRIRDARQGRRARLLGGRGRLAVEAHRRAYLFPEWRVGAWRELRSGGTRPSRSHSNGRRRRRQVVPIRRRRSGGSRYGIAVRSARRRCPVADLRFAPPRGSVRDAGRSPR